LLAGTTLEEHVVKIVPGSTRYRQRPANPKKLLYLLPAFRGLLLEGMILRLLHFVNKPDSGQVRRLTIPLAATTGTMSFAYQV
jgi:hypothetical protein